MKKLLSILLLTLLLFTCVSFWACDDSVVGVYKFYSIKYSENGIEYELKAGEKFMNTITLTEDFCWAELREDKTYIATAAGETEIGTWEEKDDGYVFIVNDEESSFSISDGNMIIEEDGYTMTLKKQ